jgi:PAS domain S-box-containing protein
MGGSAGGLEAFEQFFSHLPPDTGLAFVLVPHLEPTHRGMMPELLGRHTKMKVVEVENGMEVQPNQVYVIPPNADLAILHGRLQVLEYDRLVEDAKQVLDTLVPKESQVRSSDGRWYAMRILPYRTANNVIDGVVMTFADTTALKQTEARLQEARDFAESIIATIREPLVVLDGQLRVVSASRSFYETFGMAAAETQDRPFYEIGRRQWDIPALRQLLEEVLLKSTQFNDFRMEHDFPAVGHKALLLNARQIMPDNQGRSLILLAMEDITAVSAASGQPRQQP